MLECFVAGHRTIFSLNFIVRGQFKTLKKSLHVIHILVCSIRNSVVGQYTVNKRAFRSYSFGIIFQMPRVICVAIKLRTNTCAVCRERPTTETITIPTNIPALQRRVCCFIRYLPFALSVLTCDGEDNKTYIMHCSLFATGFEFDCVHSNCCQETWSTIILAEQTTA